MWGHWLRYSSLYPTWLVRLIHKDRVQYIDAGHGETQKVDGKIGELKHDLIDENLKGINEWFERQNRYSLKDAEYELDEEKRPIKLIDLVSRDPMIRRSTLKQFAWRIPARPFIYFLYSYVWKGGVLDGKNGFIFCYMKALYQMMVIIKKYDLHYRRKENRGDEH